MITQAHITEAFDYFVRNGLKRPTTSVEGDIRSEKDWLEQFHALSLNTFQRAYKLAVASNVYGSTWITIGMMNKFINELKNDATRITYSNVTASKEKATFLEVEKVKSIVKHICKNEKQEALKELPIDDMVKRYQEKYFPDADSDFINKNYNELCTLAEQKIRCHNCVSANNCITQNHYYHGYNDDNGNLKITMTICNKKFN